MTMIESDGHEGYDEGKQYYYKITSQILLSWRVNALSVTELTERRCFCRMLDLCPILGFVRVTLSTESLTPPLWYELVVNSVSIFSWRLWSQLYILLCKGQPQVVVSCALPLIVRSKRKSSRSRSSPSRRVERNREAHQL